MRRAITVTPNTGIDHVVEVDSLAVGGVTRARSSSLFPSGKGVNVARALASLGSAVAALGFVGRESAAAFESLPGCDADFILVPGRSRINTTIRDLALGRSTHVTGCGYAVDEQDCARLLARVETALLRGDVAALSGSLPRGASKSLYASLIERCRGRGGWVLLDASGAELEEGLAAGPDCVKPNLEELGAVMGALIKDSDDEVARAARRLVERGPGRAVVSRGARGVIAAVAGERRCWRASVELGTPPACENSVGAGDALVAGLLRATLEGRAWRETLAYGVACGAANVLGNGPGVLDPAKVRELEARARVEELEEK